MNKTLKTALSALAGLAALAAVPTAAFAGSGSDMDIWLKHGRNGPSGGVVLGDNGHVVRDLDGKPVFRDDDFPKLRRHHHNPRVEIWIDPFPRHFVKVKKCSADQAVWKAKDKFGLRHVQVDYVTKHVIGVTGRKHGEWRDIVFSRAPGCPVIDY